MDTQDIKVQSDDVDSLIVNEEVIYRNRLTICILTTTTGYQFVGDHSFVHDEAYDRDAGKDSAYADAREKLWNAMSFMLRCRIHEAALPSLYEPEPS